MAARKKYYLYVRDVVTDDWVWAWEGYQYGEMRKMYIELENQGYDVDMKYEVLKEKE